MIKNILFDLGGVIMEIRRQNCINAFKALGMEHPEQWLGEYVQAGPFMGIENGSMTPAQFRDELRPHLRPGTTDAQIDSAFMDFLVGIPQHRLDALRRLRELGYNIYLLSNTNPIMWNGKIADEFNRDSRGGMNEYFDGTVTSFDACVMKPHKEIFLYAVDKLGIRPEETIFVDDSEANLASARELGFKTLLADSRREFAVGLREEADIHL